MISSGEIAAQFAAQNQFFLQQNQYAQSIGVSPPGSLAQMGSPPANIQTPGGSYNYGGGMFSSAYGGGNKFASNVMSGIGAGATLGGAALGMASHFGPLKALDPFISPFGAFGAARGMGMGIGASAGVAALPLAAGMIAQQGVSSFIGGAQQQSAINTTLGQNFNHFNPASRSGQGFSRDEAKAIGDQVRSLAFLPDMMTSVDELTRIMSRMKQTGAMQGVKDAAEFQRRFRESIDTMKTMAQTMGTTLEEAQAFFAHSRSMGFMNQSDQVKNAMNVQLTSGLTGMSTGQVMQLQAGGANMATSFGAKRRLGTQAVTNIAQQIGLAQRQGTLSDEMLQDVTGLQGPEAVQAGAQQMTGLMAKMFQSSAGTLIGAGLAKFDSSGRAVGIDEGMAKRFNAGEISMQDLRSRASNLTQAQKISFRARAADLGMSFAGQVGPAGMGRFINEIAGGRFGSEGSNLIMQRYGASSQEADLAMQLGQSAEGMQSQMTQQMAREGQISYDSPSALMKRISTRIHASTFGQVEKLGANVQNKLSKEYESFLDELVGRHIVTMSKRSADAIERAMSGGNKQELHDMFAAVGGFKNDFANGLPSSPNAWTVGSLFKGGAAALGTIGGGPAGALVGADLGDKVKGLIDKSSIGGSLGESGIANLFRSLGNPNTTGRTDYGQLREVGRMLGESNLENIPARLRAAAGTKLGAGVGESAAKVFGGIRGALGQDYENADQSKRLELLREKFLSGVQGDMDKSDGIFGTEKRALRGLVGYETLGAVKLGISNTQDLMDLSGEQLGKLSKENRQVVMDMQSRVKSGAAHTIDEAFIQVTAGSGAINVTKIANLTGAKNIFSAANKEALIKRAKEGLKSAGIDEETQALIQSKPEIHDALEKALSNPNSEIAQILGGDEITEDPATVAEKLKGLGVHVNEGDLKSLKEAYVKMKAGDAKTMLGALSDFKGASLSGDATVMKQSLGKSAVSISNALKSKGKRLTAQSQKLLAGLSEAALGVSKAETADELNTAFFGNKEKGITGFQGSLAAAQQEFLKLGSSQRAEVISAAGSFGATFSRTAAIEKLKGKDLTAQEIASRLGLQGNEDAMRAIEASGVAGTRSKVHLTDERIKDLYKNLGGDIAAKGAAGQAGQALDTSKDKLNETLDGLLGASKNTNVTLSQVGTLIAANLSSGERSKHKDIIDKLEGAAKPAETTHS